MKQKNNTKQILDKNDNISENHIETKNDTNINSCFRNGAVKGNENGPAFGWPTFVTPTNGANINIFLLICIIGISLAILLEIVNVQNRRENIRKDDVYKSRYWVYSAYNDVENKNGLLKHVHVVLDRIGYEKSTNQTPWTLLWSHDYPFRPLYPTLHRLHNYQKVNHFPGTGFITSKVDLATSSSRFIPKAFKIPENKTEFLKYASENKDALFLEKHNQHRGVYLKNVTAIDLSSGESFVQEFIQKPFLVDGHKFDIGVYVVLTSVNPLRVYRYKGDVLFRYCPAKYYPFDAQNLDKYVIGDDYLPTWEVPSLAQPYALGYSMKDSFEHYAKSKGLDTKRMWKEVDAAITEVFIKKEHHIIEALKHYPPQDNFFEMMRFDLVIDEDLKVYLLEANMSPNLSSAHFPPNQVLFEQVLYNLFSLIGLASFSNVADYSKRNMISSQKNIAVYSKECNSICRDDCGVLDICKLCKPCLNPRLRYNLLNAHREYIHQGDFSRLFPPAMKPGAGIHNETKSLNEMNRLEYIWYQGKCNEDVSWCI